MQALKRLRGLAFFNYTYWNMGLLACMYLLVRSAYWWQAPVYDAWEYYNIMRDFTGTDFDLLKGNADHNAQLWMAVAGLPNLLLPDNILAFNVWISVLSTGAALSVYMILRHLCGGILTESEIFLASVLVAFNPSILCNLIHFSPDTGIFLFMVFTWLALLKEQRLLATLCGCVLVFSKEQGIAYLAVLHGFCAYQRPLQEQRLRFLRRNAVSLFIPYALMMAYALYKVFIRHVPFFFDNPNVFTGIDNGSLPVFAQMCFVLNANWLFIAIGLPAAISLLCRKPSTARMKAYRDLWPSYLLLMAVVTVIALMVRHWPNCRYLLAYNLVFMICFIYALAGLRSHVLRHVTLVILAAFMFCQNYRTLDPVSLRVFCTTSFGSHTLLHISWRDGCFEKTGGVSLQRDQGVYNLEFTQMNRLDQEIIRRYGEHAVYLGPKKIIHGEHQVYLKAYYRKGEFIPSILCFEDFLALIKNGTITNDFYVIDVAGLPLGSLHQFHQLQDSGFEEPDDPDVVDVSGYSLRVHHFVRSGDSE